MVAGALEDLVHRLVVAVGVVVEEDKPLGLDLGGDAHAFLPVGVAPGAVAFHFFGGVLGVVDEGVGAVGQPPHRLVALPVAGLVVGGVDEHLAVALDAIPQAALGVVQAGGAQHQLVVGDAFLLDLEEVPVRPHGAHVDREVRVGHLLFQGLLHAAVVELVGVKEELVLRVVERREEGDALDVVPVVVGQEDAGLDGLLAELFFQRVAERADAGAAVEDEEVAALSAELETRRVAAVAEVARRRRGGRAAHAPETQLHSGSPLYPEALVLRPRGLPTPRPFPGRGVAYHVHSQRS